MSPSSLTFSAITRRDAGFEVLRRPRAGSVGPPTCYESTAMKLVMTLLVRDEEDIVADNLDFHLAQGVDG